MQEEERERKDQYVPDVSALEVGETGLDIDADTKVSRPSRARACRARLAGKRPG